MELNQDTIQRLAYSLWEAGGKRDDSRESDWLRAERQVRDAALSQSHGGPVDESVRESFPASDAPATHLPDEPPVNAEDKWAAARAAAEAQQNEARPDRFIREHKRSGSRH